MTTPTSSKRAAGDSSQLPSNKKRALKKERAMGRPNADIVEQTKILWNDLRLKNNSKEKQRELADQLFECITGKVSEIGK